VNFHADCPKCGYKKMHRCVSAKRASEMMEAAKPLIDKLQVEEGRGKKSGLK
jgi:hypothetical protein